MHRFLQRPEVLSVLEDGGPSAGSASGTAAASGVGAVDGAGSGGELWRGGGGHSPSYATGERGGCPRLLFTVHRSLFTAV